MLYLGTFVECSDVHCGLCAFRGCLIVFISDFKFETGTHINANSMIVQEGILTCSMEEIEKRINHIEISNNFKKFLVTMINHIKNLDEITGKDYEKCEDHCMDIICNHCEHCIADESIKQFFVDFFKEEEDKDGYNLY